MSKEKLEKLEREKWSRQELCAKCLQTPAE